MTNAHNTYFLACALALTACLRPGEERAPDDLEVGLAESTMGNVVVKDGLAAVRRFENATLELWANAPILQIELQTNAEATWDIIVNNALSDAELVTTNVNLVLTNVPTDRPTVRHFRVAIPAGTHGFTLTPPQGDSDQEFFFAVMSDIQTAMGSVDEVFSAISREKDVSFVVSMGDISQRAEADEYDQFEEKLKSLRVPYYTTVGNHDLWQDPSGFRARYGRLSQQFWFHQTAFTLVDSGNAGLDLLVYDWLDDWLKAAANSPHVFLTHYPPLDPSGVRSGAFRSRLEAHKLLAKFAQNNVDLTLYGHIHTFIQFENAGIPAFVSGGGGAEPEKWDGIGRHFLVVQAVPEENRIGRVAIVRVD